MSKPGQYPQPNPFGQQPGVPYASPPPPTSGDNQLGTIALLCGVLSFFMGCPLSIAAIIMGWIGMKKEPKGMATAGFVIGIISLTLQLLIGCVIAGLYLAAIGTVVAVAAAAGPSIQTVGALSVAQTRIQQHQQANQAYPADAEGTAMIADLKDGWGHPFVYRLDPDREYVISSPGPDGIPGNDDDVEADAFEMADLSSNPDVDPTTEDAIYQAVEAIGVMSETSEYYPTDAAGNAAISQYKDQWGRPLVYRQTEGGESYLIISLGPDGVVDTADDITDEEL